MNENLIVGLALGPRSLLWVMMAGVVLVYRHRHPRADAATEQYAVGRNFMSIGEEFVIPAHKTYHMRAYALLLEVMVVIANSGVRKSGAASTCWATKEKSRSAKPSAISCKLENAPIGTDWITGASDHLIRETEALIQAATGQYGDARTIKIGGYIY